MTRIHIEHAAQARQSLGKLTLHQKEQLGGDIFAAQPNLLASVLALNGLGVSHARMEPILHILFMLFDAVRRAGLRLPVITETHQDLCLARIVGRSRFIEGLSSQLADQATQDQVHSHPEKFLLALVVGELKDHDFFPVRTESDKFCVLAALNLVETIAHVARGAPSDQLLDNTKT